MHAPSEIRQFDFAVDADEDVLGLDVSMDDVFFVQILEGGSHLSNVLGGEKVNIPPPRKKTEKVMMTVRKGKKAMAHKPQQPEAPESAWPSGASCRARPGRQIPR